MRAQYMRAQYAPSTCAPVTVCLRRADGAHTGAPRDFTRPPQHQDCWVLLRALAFAASPQNNEMGARLQRAVLARSDRGKSLSIAMVSANRRLSAGAKGTHG